MTTAFDELFQTNVQAEEDGIWVDVPGGVKMKIRAYTAKAVGDLREKLTKPHQTILRQGFKIPDAESEEIGLQVIAGAVIAGWEGLTATTKNEDGTETKVPVPYTPATAYEYLKRLPKLANFVIGVATDSTFFKDAELKEDGAKN